MLSLFVFQTILWSTSTNQMKIIRQVEMKFARPYSQRNVIARQLPDVIVIVINSLVN